MAVLRLEFFFLLLGQNGLEHISGLGDVGEIYLGRNALGRPRRSSARLAGRPVAALEMRANLLGLISLQ